MLRVRMATAVCVLASILLPVQIGDSVHSFPIEITKAAGASTNEPSMQVNLDHSNSFHQQPSQRVAVAKVRTNKPNKQYRNIPLSHTLQDYIQYLCSKYHVDQQLVYAVMKTESNFNPDKISDTNDYGLFQINQVNFSRLRDEIGFTKPLDAYQNAKAGVYMLSKLNQHFSSKDMVILAYNRGIHGAENLAAQGITQTDYVKKVKSNMSSITNV